MMNRGCAGSRKDDEAATKEWLRLSPQLTVLDDVVSLDRPTIFTASKQ